MIPNLFKKKTAVTLALGGALSIAAIACGSDDGAPAAGGNGPDGDSSVPTPPPSSIQSGFDSVRQLLTTNGALVVSVNEEPGGLLDGALINVLINGEQAEVYEFASTSDADAAAQTVSSDGTTITSGDTPPIAIDFLNRPHYFQQGNVIVVYTGGDSEVIELLRDALGEEFAGDRSPIDPQDDPGYETVLAPAPMEFVELIEDADNPGFFLLQVTSGLPNGCASFHDWSVDQTGELELTLSVLNRVPAPDQLIACTEIYGLVEHTIPLGSAQDNLDACEVYTVRWQSRGNDESLKFQVTAPNVRCAAPDEPIDGGDGPVINPIISDLDALILSLRAAGIDIVQTGDQGSKLFPGVVSQVVTINGERVELFSFGPGDGSLKAAAGVSSDGFQVSTGTGTEMFLSWISTPHFYLAGNSIVLYVGVNDEIVTALDQAVGQKFAGPNSKRIEPQVDPPGPQPLPGNGDVVFVPAPVVSVGVVVIAESFPPQYFLQVTSAQPNGCDRDAGWEVDVEGTDIVVTVFNSQPADLTVVLCAAIYGETVNNVRLGSAEFESGVEYTVIVNGKVSDTFTAQ